MGKKGDGYKEIKCKSRIKIYIGDSLQQNDIVENKISKE